MSFQNTNIKKTDFDDTIYIKYCINATLVNQIFEEKEESSITKVRITIESFLMLTKHCR